MIIQRPELYGLQEYLGEPTQSLLAVHFVKNRDGEPNWIPFQHNLANNSMIER